MVTNNVAFHSALARRPKLGTIDWDKRATQGDDPDISLIFYIKFWGFDHPCGLPSDRDRGGGVWDWKWEKLCCCSKE
jgi:hypothetical protein